MSITRRHRDLLLIASILTYLLVTLGGVVCVTDSSRGCPDWPACYGRLVPPPRLDSILEYTHRVLAALASLSIVAAAVVGLSRARAVRWVSRPPAIAILFLIAVIIFGAMVVLRGLEPGLAALDLGSALVVLALMLTATVVAVRRHEDPDLADRLSFASGFAKLALSTLVAVFVVLVSGILVAEEGSAVRCLGWPLGGGLDLAGARSLLGAIAGMLIITLVVQAWRLPARPKAMRFVATATGAAFAIEIAIGGLTVLLRSPVWLHVAYAATATALWALLVVLAVGAALHLSRTTS